MVAQQHGGVGAEEGLAEAVEGVGQGRVVAEVHAVGVFDQRLHGVGHLAAVIPRAHRARAADRDRQALEEPRRHIDLVDADLADQAERELLGQAPVEILGPRIAGRGAPPRGALMPVRTRHRHLPEGTGADELEHMQVLRIGALLQAAVEDQLACCRSRRDRARVVDGVGERHLAVDVLAGGKRGDDQILMLMSWSGGPHRLHRLVGEDLGGVGAHGGLGRQFLGTTVDAFVAVADAHHVGAGGVAERGEQGTALFAQADHCAVDRFDCSIGAAGRRRELLGIDVAAAEEQTEGGERADTDELAAVQHGAVGMVIVVGRRGRRHG